MTNRYPAKCCNCGTRVATGTGTCTRNGRRWDVAHVDCAAPGIDPRDMFDAAGIDPRDEARVMVTRFNSGAVVTMNRNGRCEDAPCCGCCT